MSPLPLPSGAASASASASAVDGGVGGAALGASGPTWGDLEGGGGAIGEGFLLGASPPQPASSSSSSVFDYTAFDDYMEGLNLVCEENL